MPLVCVEEEKLHLLSGSGDLFLSRKKFRIRIGERVAVAWVGANKYHNQTGARMSHKIVTCISFQYYSEYCLVYFMYVMLLNFFQEY